MALGAFMQILRSHRFLTFTFIEVLVAVAILGLSLVMLLGILGGARSKLLRAEQRWAREHLLAQVTELYLLAGPDADRPDDLLPEGFTSGCEIVDPQELPEHALDPQQGWMLVGYRVTLYGTDGEVVASHDVEKIVYEDEL